MMTMIGPINNRERTSYSQKSDLNLKSLRHKLGNCPTIYLNTERKRIEDAIEIFKLNIKAYPKYANGYDSLAEAYMISGNKTLAIKNYTKSLELDPNNTNAVEKLNELTKKK